MNEHCQALRNPSALNFAVSFLLALGIVISYFPQHLRIIHRKTSEGISPWFLLLQVSSGTCAACNIFLLSGPIFRCFSYVSGYEFVAAVLGLTQVALQAIMASTVLVLCVVAVSQVPTESIVVAKVCLVHFLLSVAISIYVFIYEPMHIDFLANLMGVMAIILALIQYFPQIYTTWTLKHTGSLSIPMMCMQTPGGFIWSASLAFREGTTWSSWSPFLTAAMLQGTLLMMAVYYEYVGPKTNARNETAPLLSSNV